MPTATVTAVTEHIAGSELAADLVVGTYPDEVLYPSATLYPSGFGSYPSGGEYPSTGLYPGAFPSEATQISVVDINDFWGGGYVTLVDQDDGTTVTVPYSVPSDSTGEIDLEGVIAATFSIGDMAYVTDSAGQQFPERWCGYLEPQAEEVGWARVPHTLYDRLAMGIRNDDNAEQITFAEDGTDLVVTDVLGKSPVQDLSSVLVTTDPSQSGERVDIDQDGIREIEADGTTVAVSLTQAEGLDLLVDTGLADHISRIVRWLTASGVTVAYVGAFDDGFQDGIALHSKASDATRKATADLYAQTASGFTAQIHVESTDSGGSANSKFYLSSPAAGQKNLLIDNAGSISSDFLFDNAWADWTPTLSGWSANPTNSVYRYKQIGKMVVASIRQATNGTSNATTKSITAPVAAATISNMIWAEVCSATDNGSALATSSGASIASGSSTINFSKDLSTTTGGWTASGGHKIQTCTLIYEAA